MNYNTLKDIIGWDIVNWSKSIDYWEKRRDWSVNKLNCLELGGREGGLSLWLALKGNHVICSDLNTPEEKASEIHKKYACNSLIDYQAIDATDIPYENTFDIITFKSILGGISSYNNSLKQKTTNEIYKALKPGGTLLFAENIESSFIHRFLRKHFVDWGKDWNYLKFDELNEVFSSFKSVDYITVGFFGAFGRSEKQRAFFGHIDRFFEKCVPRRKRYILIGIAKK